MAQDAASAVRAQLRRTVEALAEVRDVEVGWVARCRDLPLVHTLNQLHVSTSAPAERLLALAEAHLGDLPYRHVVADDEATAASLARTPGAWTTEREVLMVLTSARAPGAGTAPVVELGAEEALGLMHRWSAEEGLDATPGVIEQLDEYQRREGELWHERLLGVRDDGVAVALTKLRTDGVGTAWVEDVYTLPEARRRGHARALVTRAVRAALGEGHGLVFIIADDDDWPKHLYAELGFRPVARRWAVHTSAPAPTRPRSRAPSPG